MSVSRPGPKTLRRQNDDRGGPGAMLEEDVRVVL